MKDNLDVPDGSEEEGQKKQVPPHKLKRIRVCGRWQKTGYKASAKEKAAWVSKCKSQNRDPKTGKKFDPKAAKK